MFFPYELAGNEKNQAKIIQRMYYTILLSRQKQPGLLCMYNSVALIDSLQGVIWEYWGRAKSDTYAL